MRQFAITTGFILFLTFILTGCGGGSSSSNQTVTQVVLSPSNVSVNAGEVVQLGASAQNSAGNSVSATITYKSSNSNIASVSTAGEICGGTWDATFIVCNGLSGGNFVSGTATITAIAGGVTSNAVTVSVHPKVTAVTVDGLPVFCASMTQTRPLTAHAFSNGVEITNQVGPFTWTSLDPVVATVDTNGVLTARNPGVTGIFAGIASVTSTPAPYRTCMPVRIRVHTSANASTTSATLSTTQTQALGIDFDDENGITILTGDPFSKISNNIPSATVNNLTITAVSPGGAGIVAVCIPPACGNGVNSPVYSNLFSVNVTGTSPSTTVYATSSFAPPSGTSATMIPIDTGTHAVGTAIGLPAVPNSLVFGSQGTRAWLGTTAGLATLDPAAAQVTLVAPDAVGKVLAVSSDGNRTIVSNAANDPGFGVPIEPDPTKQRIWVFDLSTRVLQTITRAGAVAASFDPDNFKAYIAANDGNVYVFSTFFGLQNFVLGGSPVDVASLASMDFNFFANSGSLDVVTTCNNSVQSSALATAHQKVAPMLNQDVMVAVSSTGLDIDTVTVTPTPGTQFCPPPSPAHSVAALNFGVGSFTARQLLVTSNGSRAVVLPAGTNKVLVTDALNTTPVPATITLPAGATEPLAGSLLLDGNSVWVSVAGTNTIDLIDLKWRSNIDSFLICENLRNLWIIFFLFVPPILSSSLRPSASSAV